MIDERINKSLAELEKQLKDVDAAKKQVEQTVNAYDGLKKSTKAYSDSLNDIQSTLKDIVSLVGEDYSNKVQAFEDEIKRIQSLATESIENTNNASTMVTNSVSNVVKSTQRKLTISIVLSAITLLLVTILQIYPLIIQTAKHIIK